MVGDLAGKVAGSFFLVELVVLAVDKRAKTKLFLAFYFY